MSESESLVCPNCSERSPAGYILCPYCGFDLTKIVKATQRVRITFKESFSRIWRGFFDPRQSKHLFKEVGANPDRRGAIITLILVSMAYASRIGVYAIKVSSTTWHDFHFWYALFFPFIVWPAFFLLALFAWFILSTAIWLLAKTLGGKAGYRDTMSVVGYSVSPLISGSLIISLIVVLIGPPISNITTVTWEQFTLFEVLYLPFIVLAAYHCGNGLRASHLLSEPYSYSISGIMALLFIIFYLLPVML